MRLSTVLTPLSETTKGIMLYSKLDPKLIARHIRSLNLPPEDEKKIFGGNALRLFRL